ncbi:hypothetical protein B1813_05565 [Saccharomonospora piscinae]|uniref:DUF3000 domain-containing protein n=1 Tax=Saccharomonospora piscinae TaxID=687388 RepID=A0A1V9AAC2_SACPI|nr:DUF3000 domain-containing protein [Saccharomonospora piscinae]OQO93976.1 hypothetical protein B1813_05565 [Saccharomonospora piscinae]TLW95392.1 DUF3000 domain-containing protein [Saccharomonospora piscinae]
MTQAPEEFRAAVAALRSVRTRPEVTLEPIKAPQRLAPWAFALAAETTGPDDVPATGRLVLLHDPDGHDGWDGVFRLVVYLRAELDPELATDPFLPAVGWSWLTDALDASGASWTALGGTVTGTSSARFGDISGPSRTDDVELRASWTPTSPELEPHGEAFSQTLAHYAGLPPVGVTAFGQRRG